MMRCAGVGSSLGAIYDFAGAGVNVGDFTFGLATKYVQLRPDAATALKPLPDLASAWDRALAYSEAVFDDRPYSFFQYNCHQFVRHFLENIRFGGRASWNIVFLVRFTYCRVHL
jgi:hypothetical protein